MTEVEQRMVEALERIAESSDQRLFVAQATERIKDLEDVLKTVMSLMEDPQSTDQAWKDWLEEAKAVMEPTV